MTEHDVPAQTESAQCTGEATAAIRNKKKTPCIEYWTFRNFSPSDSFSIFDK